MGIPFKVNFRQKKWGGYKDIPVVEFTSSETELFELLDGDNIPTATENKWLELEFDCEDESARLYMDGFDTLPLQYLKLDNENEVYFSAADKKLLLYEDDPEKQVGVNTYYPFIPGYYRMKVIHQQKAYYTAIKILPKQMTEEQWMLMKDDIEETLNGLAQDLIRKNASIGIESHHPYPLDMLRKLYIIKKDFSKWVLAISEVETQPRYRVGKEYQLVNEGKRNIVDERGVRYRARHPESKGYIYNPKHIKNFNLPENKWIKYIIRYLLRELNQLSNYLEIHSSRVKEELEDVKNYQKKAEHVQVRTKMAVLNELEDYGKFVNRMRYHCLRVLQTDWMTEVDEKKPVLTPMSIHLDMTYRQIYQLYRLMKLDEIDVTFNKKYDFYWKRTDLLYEIWGFLQFIKGLQHESLGFEVTGGWIYDFSNTNSIEVPFLKKGTYVDFQKGTIKVRLVYDYQFSTNREATLAQPLFLDLDEHSRPDAVLHFYNTEGEVEYIGSIVADFKYRPLRHIWDASLVSSTSTKKFGTMRQFIWYKNELKSTLIYNVKKPGMSKRYVSIKEVWGLYPKHESNRHTRKETLDSQVKMIELTPNEENNEFYQQLKETIDEILDEYEDL